jgi:hypothetical protein
MLLTRILSRQQQRLQLQSAATLLQYHHQQQQQQLLLLCSLRLAASASMRLQLGQAKSLAAVVPQPHHHLCRHS